jgi:anthranilate synthase/aminodeoxychorismate synthase-like glutamine amidotransferase
MILVIDNYDSFTWNLVQYLGQLGADLRVHRNDELTVEQIRELRPEAIVISPGPCTPAEAGVSVNVIRALGTRVPILGVCLGHQAIGAAYGGKVIRGDRLMHGKTSAISHSGAHIFADVPSPITVARYHSLVIDPESLPLELEVIARTAEEGFEHEIQAVRHRVHPVWGVQFHPESIASEHGLKMLSNFLASV